MDMIAWFIVFSMLRVSFGTELCNPDGSAIPNDTWKKRYTFAFITLDDNFTRNIKITPRTEGRICISIPCMNYTNCSCITPETGISLAISPMECAIENSAIELFSSHEIIVHGLVLTGAGSAMRLTGGFLALPHEYLGTEYLIDCYRPSGESHPQFTISAIENDTLIYIYCELDTSKAPCTGPKEISQTLHSGMTYRYDRSRITGIYIRSDKPVAVVVGSGGVYIPRLDEDVDPYNPDSLDTGFIIEQLLPMSAWGTDHLVPPLQNSTNGWNIRLTSNNTVNVRVQVHGDSDPDNITVEAKVYYDIEVIEGWLNQSYTIVSDQPIQVMQYMRSSTNIQMGDASMMIVPPIRDYHGNTTLRVRQWHDEIHFADIIVSECGRDSIRIAGESVSRWWCLNVSSDSQRYSYTMSNLSEGSFQFTQSDQSVPFLLRYYGHAFSTGAAMLADIAMPQSQANETTTHCSTSTETMQTTTDVNTTSVEASTGADTTYPQPMGTTSIEASTGAPSMSEQRSRLERLLNASIDGFRSFGDAEVVMTMFLSSLGETEELGSAEDVAFAFGSFAGVLTREPLKNATTDQAKIFLNLTSNAVNVMFSSSTNELIAETCSMGMKLDSTAEDVQRELEGLVKQAAGIIVEGGQPSFGIQRTNAAIELSTTDSILGVTSGVTPGSSCSSMLGLTSSDVDIPCEVIQELGAQAAYRMYLPHAAEAIARSNCSYNETIETVASSLISVGLLTDGPQQKFSKNISISFDLTSNQTQLNMTGRERVCAFWNYTESKWSRSGCTIDPETRDTNRVTCICDHLTSFAVLVSSKESSNPEVMHFLTWVGCSFSIVACFFTCFGYAILRLKSDIILIHGNLALALGIAEITFLCIDAVTPGSVPCTVVAALVYYFFLAMFCWMAIEGVHLYLLTFVVWNAERRKITYYLPCGWGIPLLLTIVLVGVYEGELGDENLCFLRLDTTTDPKDLSLLYFLVPVGLVIVFNFMVTSRVVYQITKLAGGPALQGDIPTKVKHGVKGLMLLLPIMGLTWVFGIIAVEGAADVFQYIFIVLNSLQGVFIFLVHFVRNSEVQHAFQRKKHRWSVTHSKPDDYKVKISKKSSSSNEKASSTVKTPEQTLTLSNMHAN